MGCSDGAGVTTPALVWNLSTRSTGTQIPLSWLIPMPGSAAAPLPLQHSSRTIWNASSWGPQIGWESPEKGAEPGELFSRSHFIIVAKETSSQDLAWNMSASAGPHIHLSQSALRAGAGADKGGDGGGGCSGTTAAALNRPARAGCAARKSCQGSYKTKKNKNPNGICSGRQQGQEFEAMLRGLARCWDEQGHRDGSSRSPFSSSLILVPGLWRGLVLPAPCPPVPS